MSSRTGAGAADRTVRHGGSETGASGRGGGLTGSGSGAVSRTVSASWIADSAASIGSFILFGAFAMSVVASYYAGPEPPPGQVLIPPRARLASTYPPDPPRAVGSHAPYR